MHALYRSVFFTLLGVVLAVASAEAQAYAGTIGYGGGGVWFGDFNEGSGRSLTLDPGWVASAHIERYFGGGYLGARANAAFTRRPLETSADRRDINTWFFDGDVLLRPVPLRESTRFSPFLSLGAGVVSYGLGEGPRVVFEEENALYPGDSDRRLAGVGGLGMDILPGWTWFGTPVGFRLEGLDYVVFDSPFESLEGADYGPVHNVRVTLSLTGLVDLIP